MGTPLKIPARMATDLDCRKTADASLSRMALDELDTPCLILDETKMGRNIARLRTRLRQLGVMLRPHLKTAKSIDIARRVMDRPTGPVTVSTLREAEVFADGGVRDILYAVGIAPQKLDRVLSLRRRGIDLCLVLDDLLQAVAVVAAVRETGDRLPVMIELDADGHRGGIRLGDPRLVEIGRLLRDGGATFRGVMTHAGDSYNCQGAANLETAVEQERTVAVASAQMLRSAGLPCPIVSVGATPTALFARDLSGVTEVRAGTFIFFDLVMLGIGVCSINDLALSVLATVIGHQRERGWTLVDAGWMALSRDRGTAKQEVDQGYGIVCNLAGKPYRDLIAIEVSQEHGIVALRPGSTCGMPELPIGTRVRIVPNHACATGAQHDRYYVTSEGKPMVHTVWERFRGW